MENKIAEITQGLEVLREVDKEFIKFGAKQHKYISTKTEIGKLNLFEEKFNFTFPSGVKEFYSQIGYGAGPNYGILSLEEIEIWVKSWADFFKVKVEPGRETCLNNEKIEEYNRDKEDGLGVIIAENLDGIIPVSNCGASNCNVLVLNGDQEGYIWTMNQEFPATFVPTNMKFFQWYEKWLREFDTFRKEGSMSEVNNREAEVIINSGNLNIAEIKKLLVLSMHSSTIAKQFFIDKVKENDIEFLRTLVEITKNFEDSGEAPVAASNLIKDYPIEDLKLFEGEILYTFLNDNEHSRKFLAIALAKLKSESARRYISQLSEQFESELIFKLAVQLYEI
ncbi:MAG: SMI1/KNR4 family protein [Clostridiaceae bacterium]